MAGRVSNATEVAGGSVPAPAVAEEIAALDRAGAMVQATATLIAVTRRSLADRLPDAEVDAPRVDAGAAPRGIQSTGLTSDLAPAPDKQYATLAALAARRGITLLALADGSFMLSRWGLSRALPDLCVVASLLRQMGVNV